MTSSLVGSEMCIRDSINGVALEHCCPSLIISSPCHEGREASKGAKGRGCLLYTSDAADDM
eukprot:5640383-Prorocentrum_lima.AAC.1